MNRTVLTQENAKRIEDKIKNVEVEVNKNRNCLEFYVKAFNGFTFEYFTVGTVFNVFGKVSAMARDSKGKRKEYKTLRGLLNFLLKEYVQTPSLELVTNLYNSNITDCQEPKKQPKSEEKEVEFKPELTAIDTRYSTSADMIAKIAEKNTPILDYGCGTGRNIKHLLDNTPSIVCGTDIPEQLEKEKIKHKRLTKASRCVIMDAEKIQGNYFKIALNSHVLNVIESDEVKQYVVCDIYKKLSQGGTAYFEVRTKSDVEGAKTKEAHGDGWKIKKGNCFTYQEAITKEKMVRLITNAGFTIKEHIFNASKHIVVATK